MRKCLALVCLFVVGCVGKPTKPVQIPVAAPTRIPVKTALPQGTNLVVFFGDSLTSRGFEPGGYLSILDRKQRENLIYGDHIRREFVGRGVGGNTVRHLLARVDSDVLSLRPAVVVVEVGVNDSRTLEAKEFEHGLGTLVDKLTDAGCSVVLCTLALCGEKTDGSNLCVPCACAFDGKPIDERIDLFAEIARRVARAKGVTLCDLRQACVAYLKDHNPDNVAKGILTTDTVHLAPEGNRIVAEEIAKCLPKAGVKQNHPHIRCLLWLPKDQKQTLTR